MTEVQWMNVVGFENYQITPDGAQMRNVKTGGLIAPAVARGYRCFRPHRNGKRVWMYVHRLVLEAHGFMKPNAEAVCRHLDGDKLNNHISNLCWGTQAENVADAIRHGRHRIGTGSDWRGVKSPGAKLTPELAEAIRRDGRTIRKVAAAYGVSYGCVWSVKNGKTWNTSGTPGQGQVA